MAKTVFSKIINKEIDHHLIYEDDLTIAFLDHKPVTKGHTLVIPKAEIDHLDDCPDELYQAVFTTVHKVSKRLRTELKPKRIALVVHGFEIPHAHIHIVPMYTGHELHLADREVSASTSEELAELTKKLQFPTLQ